VVGITLEDAALAADTAAPGTFTVGGKFEERAARGRLAEAAEEEVAIGAAAV
jgi:hypothetical protein